MKYVAVFFVVMAAAAVFGMFALSVRWFISDEVAAYGGFFGAFFLSAISAAIVAAYAESQEEKA